MALGGVPHYLENLQRGESVQQALDRLCFSRHGLLNDEFDRLFVSLFDDSERHLKIIKTLTKTNTGLTRNELIEQSNLPSGGDFSLKLEELVESGFVTEYPYYRNKKQRSLFRLSDEYTKFYLKFIDQNRKGGDGTWQRLGNTQSFKSWSGFAFETLCLKHIHAVKRTLRIDAIYSTSSSWFNAQTQIDVLIDRDDNVINLCELKFYNAPFIINKSYYLDLKKKIDEFKRETNTRKSIFLTMITTYGVQENQYSKELMQNNLDMNALFHD
jgi:hypothetical protein